MPPNQTQSKIKKAILTFNAFGSECNPIVGKDKIKRIKICGVVDSLIQGDFKISFSSFSKKQKKTKQKKTKKKRTIFFYVFFSPKITCFWLVLVSSKDF